MSRQSKDTGWPDVPGNMAVIILDPLNGSVTGWERSAALGVDLHHPPLTRVREVGVTAIDDFFRRMAGVIGQKSEC